MNRRGFLSKLGALVAAVPVLREAVKDEPAAPLSAVTSGYVQVVTADYRPYYLTATSTTSTATFDFDYSPNAIWNAAQGGTL